MIEPGDPYGFDWTFVGLEQRLGVVGRVYKIFVGDRLLCGAAVRAPVLPPLWPRAAGWTDPEQWVPPRSLERYDGVNVTSPYFLRRARGNFHLSRARLTAADLSPAGPSDGLVHSGTLRLRFTDGRSRRFVLLGDQDAEAITRRLYPEAG